MYLAGEPVFTQHIFRTCTNIFGEVFNRIDRVKTINKKATSKPSLLDNCSCVLMQMSLGLMKNYYNKET